MLSQHSRVLSSHSRRTRPPAAGEDHRALGFDLLLQRTSDASVAKLRFADPFPDSRIAVTAPMRGKAAYSGSGLNIDSQGSVWVTNRLGNFERGKGHA